MATEKQLKDLDKVLKTYKRVYMKREYSEVDESATRIMVNHLLSKVLGYEELKEIKTEFLIRGAYADYVIQLNRKKHFVVEVKSIQLDLNDQHLRQSIGYAANEGIDWAILTNGRQLRCYHIEFTKPIKTQLFFDVAFDNIVDVRTKLAKLYLLTRKSITKLEINSYWKKFTSLEPKSIAGLLYTDYVVKYIKRSLRKTTGVNFTIDEVTSALSNTIKTGVDTNLRLKK